MENQKLELWYFYGPNCAICHDLWPKVKALVEDEFPNLQLRYLNIEQHRELAAQNRMLSVPGILFWVAGREYFRANGFLYLKQLRDKLRPSYKAYYQ